MLVLDPQWIRPTITIELQPGESVGVGADVVVNTGEMPMMVPDVLDESAVHPWITVDNPACRIPVDSVPISNERHLELLEGQAEGKLIREDALGNPILVDLPPPTIEQLAASERVWRNSQLTATDCMVVRHRDEVEEGSTTTLAPELYLELQVYRRELRDWPNSEHFPDAEHRPARPDWLDQPTP